MKRYLINLFKTTYYRDIIERNHLRNEEHTLEILVKFLVSNIGSLTNPTNLSNTIKSEMNFKINSWTINKYFSHFIDSFIINKVERYDVKGKK